ncbi:MAG: hypothetical protein ACREM1_04135 [Longimicrobiales bacterium]
MVVCPLEIAVGRRVGRQTAVVVPPISRLARSQLNPSRNACAISRASLRFSGSPWVFHHVRRNGHAECGERIHSLRRAVAGAARRASIATSFRQHDLGHRRVTKWLAARASCTYSTRSGANIATTMKYTHLADQHVDALLEHEATRGKAGARPAANA